jgi:hypothetical protein
MFFAGAWGYSRLLKLPVTPAPASAQAQALPAGGGSLLGNGSALLALTALIGTGLLAALLVLDRRLSPLAAALPGAALLGWTLLYLVSVRQAVDLIPLRTDSFGAGWEALLFHGVLGAAGAVLIAPALIPARWRNPRAAGSDVPGSAAARTADRAQPDEQRPAAWPDEEPALSGTVLPYPAAGVTRPVDTTRITGASRALRATGSFRAVPGSVPRTSGWFGSVPDNSPDGRR